MRARGGVSSTALARRDDRSRTRQCGLHAGVRFHGVAMSARILADVVLVVHFAFIAFVVAGGLLVLWRRAIAFVHLPAVAWAAYTEFTSTICPLTPWEQALRARAGEGYTGGFVEHYLLPVIYPSALTPRVQLVLGLLVVALNAAIYALVWWRARSSSRAA